MPMETSYTNKGKSLGYYTPPNSGELDLLFETTLVADTNARFEYQFVIHGADFGSHSVYGSSLRSELSGDRSSMTKHFLHDGAYQWFHILKIGAEHKFKKIPVKLYGETDIVISYFSDIEDEYYAPPSSYAPSYKFIDTEEYPKEIKVYSFDRNENFY